jgi:hypothetical protein
MSGIPSHVCNIPSPRFIPRLSGPEKPRPPRAGAFSFKLAPFTQGRGAAEGSKEIRPASPYDDRAIS